jgi:hypothetical protein
LTNKYVTASFAERINLISVVKNQRKHMHRVNCKDLVLKRLGQNGRAP